MVEAASAPAVPAQGADRGARVTPRRLYLVDGSGYIFRAFHALPMMTRGDGTPVNAVYGFCNMLMKLLDEIDTDGMAVVFDKPEVTFRNDIYTDYKANRPPAPDELVPQFGLIREATRAFGLASVEQDGYEADDLIATYARAAAAAGVEVIIVSSDKDLMQLVRPGVHMRDPMKNVDIGAAEVVAKFGVGPDKVIDVQALAGDSTDNVPGVPGIGVKTAAQLIGEYGDLDTLLDRAAEIKQPKRRENLIAHAELARVSRALVTLKDDVPVAETVEDFAWNGPAPETLLAFFEAQHFTSLVKRLRDRLAGAGGAAVELVKATTEAHYELVTEPAALDAWLERVRAGGFVAVTLQPRTANALWADVAGFALATGDGRACYVPVGHVAAAPQGDLNLGDLDLGDTAGAAPRQLAPAAGLAALKALFEDPGVMKAGHNIKYDVLLLAQACAAHLPAAPPLAPRALDDTMLVSFVLDSGRRNHELAALATRNFDHEMASAKALVGTSRNEIPFAAVAPDKALTLAAERADMTGRLHRALKPRLVPDRMTTVYETIERPLAPILAAMEQAGVLVDKAALARLSEDFAGRMATLEAHAHDLAGEAFNLASPKQLGEILFDKLGMEGGRKGKTGAYTTGAEVLETLAAQGHDLPQVALDWRLLSKLKSTYTDTLIEQVNPATGRVHTAYSMTGAQTGRLSSNEPNLQNIPVRTEEGRKIRDAFVAAAGCRLVSLDYSQIELRIVAHVAGIAPLIEAFKDGADIHAMTASQVFGVPVEGMDPLLRRRAKAINFGIIYGISAFGLARNLGIARAEAKAYIDAYFERYPGIRAYMDATIAYARANGYVETLFGRRIYLAAIHDRNPNHRGFAERQAINAPIQGTAADIIKRAMLRVPPALAAAGLGHTGFAAAGTRSTEATRMLLQVHDELLFEVPEAQLDTMIATVRPVMEGAMRPVMEMTVPLVVDAGTGHTWNEAH